MTDDRNNTHTQNIKMVITTAFLNSRQNKYTINKDMDY